MLTDQALRAYEKYITSERNIEETLNLLPQHSEDYLFLKLLHIMNQQGLAKIDSEKDLKEEMEKIKKNSPYRYNERLQTLSLRECLLRYDAATTEEERQKALNTIKENGYIHWDHNHTKPTNLKKIKKSNEEVKAGDLDDTSEEEDPELARYQTEFKSQEAFTRDRLVEAFIRNNDAGSIHPVRFS
jgi:selenocysteine-specific translation elongation factor